MATDTDLLIFDELPEATENDLNQLLKRGGFPEPFLTPSDDDANRWRLQYIDGLIHTDILDFEKIQGFRAIQLTLNLLRRRVGSPVSWSSLARAVNCAPNTIKKYVTILESLYIVFRVTPFHRNIGRSLLKEPKLYFYDTGLGACPRIGISFKVEEFSKNKRSHMPDITSIIFLTILKSLGERTFSDSLLVIGDEGIRLENLVAVSLLKHLHWREDSKGISCSLHPLRTGEKKKSIL